MQEEQDSDALTDRVFHCTCRSSNQGPEKKLI